MTNKEFQKGQFLKTLICNLEEQLHGGWSVSFNANELEYEAIKKLEEKRGQIYHKARLEYNISLKDAINELKDQFKSI